MLAHQGHALHRLSTQDSSLGTQAQAGRLVQAGSSLHSTPGKREAVHAHSVGSSRLPAHVMAEQALMMEVWRRVLQFVLPWQAELPLGLQPNLHGACGPLPPRWQAA